jgi:translation initiation factor 5B
MIGFDASGHVAEETRNARHAESASTLLYLSLTPDCSVVAGRGILTSAFATGIMGFITSILFLFCTPDLDTLFSLNAPQPFVQIYAMALGKGPSIFMTIIAVLGLVLVTPFPPLHRSVIDAAFPVHRAQASRLSRPPV